MDRQQASKQAAKQSKALGSARFVVWVFDQGREVFDAEQTRIYATLIDIEAAFVGGVEVSTQSALEAA